MTPLQQAPQPTEPGVELVAYSGPDLTGPERSAWAALRRLVRDNTDHPLRVETSEMIDALGLPEGNVGALAALLARLSQAVFILHEHLPGCQYGSAAISEHSVSLVTTTVTINARLIAAFGTTDS